MGLPTILYFQVVRPQLDDAVYQWPGHPKPFHVPTYLPGDSRFYRGTAESLLRDGDLDLRNNIYWGAVGAAGQVSLGKRGEWYPKHPIALALAALPFYAVLGDPGLLLFNFIQLTALELLIFLLARRYVADELAIATTLAFAFGTLLRPVAYNYSPDVLSTLVVMGGTLMLLDKRVGWGGFLLALSVTVKWTNVIFLPLAALWVLATIGFPAALRFSLLALPPLLGLAALNWHMFGSPLLTPYDQVLAFNGGIEQSHRSAFDLPFWRTLWLQLWAKDLGLLDSAPFVVVAPFGLILLWRRHRAEAVLIAALGVAQILVFAPYRYWDASNFGHRFLLTAVTLAAGPVAVVIAWLLDRSLVSSGGVRSEHAL